MHEPYDLETSFVSRQTYAHLLISVHGAMLKMKLARQLDAQLDLDQIGSDCLESFFSELGGCGRFMSNRRNYDFMSVLDMASDVNLMSVLLADPDPRSRSASGASIGRWRCTRGSSRSAQIVPTRRPLDPTVRVSRT